MTERLESLTTLQNPTLKRIRKINGLKGKKKKKKAKGRVRNQAKHRKERGKRRREKATTRNNERRSLGFWAIFSWVQTGTAGQGASFRVRLHFCLYTALADSSCQVVFVYAIVFHHIVLLIEVAIIVLEPNFQIYNATLTALRWALVLTLPPRPFYSDQPYDLRLD